MIRRALAAIALSCALVSNAGAHDTFLWPSTFTPALNAEVSFELGSATAFPDFENRIAPARVDHYAVAPGDLDGPAEGAEAFTMTVRPEGRGAAMIEVQLLPRDIDLEPAEVAHYFDEIGAQPDLIAAYEAQGRGVLRETYSKSVQAIICVESCEDSGSAYSNLLTNLSFRPLARDGFDPLRVFQLLREDEPVANRQVMLSTIGAGRFTLRTDAAGVILIPHDAHGPLLLSAIILHPPAEPGARWTSDFATLTFALP